MFITPDGFVALITNGLWLVSLAICAILLLFAMFRRRSNPVAWLVWINLIVGALWYGQYPLGAAQKAAFQSANPGYANAALPFDGKSLYVPDVDALRFAAYCCYGSFSQGLCTLPVGQLIKSGRLDFIEIGTDPIRRYSIAIHDQRCHDWGAFQDDPTLNDRHISPGMAACVVMDEITAPTATHLIAFTNKTLSWPSRARFTNVQLRDRAANTLIDQFDGWNRADPFLVWDMPDEARRADGPLGQLLAIQSDRNTYDVAPDNALIASHGIDEALLISAMSSPYQSMKARTIWLACRNGVLASLSADTRAALTAASTGLFPNNPDWRYPRDCPDWMR